MPEKPVIFLAHATPDKPIVNGLYEKLCAAGFNPWYDKESLEIGVNWRLTIPEAIKKSDFFLACLSSNSIDKNRYVQEEIKLALEVMEQKPSDEIYLIPALIEEMPLPDISSGDLRLMDFHAAALYTPSGVTNFITYLQKICKLDRVDLTKMQKLLIRGKLDEFVEEMENNIMQMKGNLRNRFIVLAGNYADIREQEKSMTVTQEVAMVTKNQIVFHFLDILDEMND